MAVGVIDCDNFYVSCERILRPDIKKIPCIVLSNNDGCIIARSKEVKEMGIPMGAPLFKYKEMIEKNKILVFSSNYTLYDDISKRVMSIIKSFAKNVEVYSIDEAFVDLEEIEDKEKFLEKVKEKIEKWTKIPVSIGIGETKVLSKIALKFAKKMENRKIFNIIDHKEKDELLKKIEVEDIWGIGPISAKLLREKGITNAFQFKNLDVKWVKENLTLKGLKILNEIKGIKCFKIEENAKIKSISVSRTFGEKIESFKEIKEAVSYLISLAAERLRSENLLAKKICVYIMSSPFQKNFYYRAEKLNLPAPTAYTPDIVKFGERILKIIFKEGIKYKKAGVYLYGLIEDEKNIKSVFSDKLLFNDKKRKIILAIDKINKNFGRNTIYLASGFITKRWNTVQIFRSKRYTTRWDELKTVKVL
ncbi:MAG: Y-family DNA polymerase [Candidatus Hydrothermales bacterium]